MNISIVRTAVVVAALGAGVACLLRLHRTNQEMERELAELRRQNDERIATRAEQERKHAAAQRALAAIESRPAPPAAPDPAHAADPAATPAPLTAMLRVEDLTNRGRATAPDGLQTLIWAAIQGEDDELAASLVFGAGAREKTEAWRAKLPLESQARFATLEKMPGLFLAEEVVRKAAGMQIMKVVEDGPGKATVHARTSTLTGGLSVSKFPMEQTPTGWRLTIPAEMVEGMQKSRRGADPQAADQTRKAP
jgi:hypothetical protein